MIARVSKALNEKEKGFTLIELLVVVVIIGILAAVAIPQFLKYRENAWRSAVTQDVTNATRALEAFSTTNDGLYPASASPLTSTQAPGFNQSAGVTVNYATDSTNTAVFLSGTHEKLPAGAQKFYNYSSTTGKGTWGEAAVLGAN